MIIGAHIMIQSRDDAADQEFLTKVLGLSSVDAGNNFLIFASPPAEIAIHESDKNDVHEFFFMSDDIAGFVADMKKRGIACTPPANRGWGTMTQMTLPGGGKLSVYEPHHKRPKAVVAVKKKVAKKVSKKPAKKSKKKK